MLIRDLFKEPLKVCRQCGAVGILLIRQNRGHCSESFLVLLRPDALVRRSFSWKIIPELCKSFIMWIGN